ncbi:cellulase family glycosylhydrolase [Rubripirellula tenax]|uniref:cellulase family glycosylhydrolase n=1 Tax=Rubripirellula tenax TaxID=2528015 RepID=UPI0016493086|nr:cellulase family glycosylhydrolase [Rubripirellula tenax]
MSLHPKNARYFLFRDKPTVLVTSGEHYGLLCNAAFDVDAYFDELASDGLNHTRIFAGAYREVPGSFGITKNTLAPADRDFISPWQRTDATHRDGAPIFDLTKWDDAYFARLNKILNAASKRDIVVELCLFSPMYKPDIWDVNPMNVRNNVNAVGDVGSQQVFTTDHDDLLAVQKRLAEKLTESVASFDNVYIEICNEPYFGGVTEAWQNAIIDAVVAKQKAIGVSHLISVNVANKSKKVEMPHPAVSIFNFHYCHPPIVVAENADVHGVIGENETGFRGNADFLYRTEAWDFLVAGGATYNNLDYSFSVDHPRGTQSGYTSPGGGSKTLRQQLSVLKQVFDGLPIPQLRPLPKRFATASHDLVASAIGDTANQFLVYVHVELPGRMKDQSPDAFTQPIEDASVTVSLPKGTYRTVVIDTKTGEQTVTRVVVGANDPTSQKLPRFVTDIAVLFQRDAD